MGQIFPLVSGTSKLRAILGIIKQNGGSIKFSQLAEETEEHIDDLFPLVEACQMLGFAKVEESTITITKEGEELTFGNSLKLIKDKLAKIEPFMSALELLKKESEMSTKSLIDQLKKKGICLHGEKATNEALMKKMFLRLGVRTKLLYYDTERDIWSLATYKK